MQWINNVMVQQCLGFGNGSNKTSIGFPESQRDWSTWALVHPTAWTFFFACSGFRGQIRPVCSIRCFFGGDLLYLLIQIRKTGSQQTKSEKLEANRLAWKIQMPSNKRVVFFSKCPLSPPATKKRLPPPHGGKRKWAQRECNSAREPHCNLRSGSFSWIPQGYWLDVVVGRSACWITTLANLWKQLFLDKRFLWFEPFPESSANFLKCLSQFAFQCSKTHACRSKYFLLSKKTETRKKKHHPSTKWLLQSS